MAFDLNIWYDEKRQGHWVQGSGFDFFTYFTGDEDITYIECDHVQREGSEFSLHLTIKLGPSGAVHKDILETAIHNELNKWWGGRQ